MCVWHADTLWPFIITSTHMYCMYFICEHVWHCTVGMAKYWVRKLPDIAMWVCTALYATPFSHFVVQVLLCRDPSWLACARECSRSLSTLCGRGRWRGWLCWWAGQRSSRNRYCSLERQGMQEVLHRAASVGVTSARLWTSILNSFVHTYIHLLP